MECMSTIRLRVSVRLAHRAQVLALSSLSAKSAFFFVSFTRRMRFPTGMGIADAVWTDLLWLMPPDRTVTIAVDGGNVAVELGPPHPASCAISH